MLLVGPPFFMSAHFRAGAVSGTECRRRSKGRGRRSEQRERGPFRALKMRPVRQEAVLRAFGDAFDVAGAVLRAF